MLHSHLDQLSLPHRSTFSQEDKPPHSNPPKLNSIGQSLTKVPVRYWPPRKSMFSPVLKTWARLVYIYINWTIPVFLIPVVNPDGVPFVRARARYLGAGTNTKPLVGGREESFVIWFGSV